MYDFNQDSGRAPLPTKRLQALKVLGYVVLLLVVTYLYLSSPDSTPAGPNLPTSPASSAENHPREVRLSPPQPRPAPDKAKGRQGASGTVAAKSTKPAERNSKGAQADALIARNVRLTNQQGRVIYRGDVDLAPTLERIDRGERLRFSHDGIVFENREKRLPIKPKGYYREFIHPTEGESGPGGQRIVIGQDGEAYYSPDHYRTFRRLR